MSHIHYFRGMRLCYFGSISKHTCLLFLVFFNVFKTVDLAMHAGGMQLFTSHKRSLVHIGREVGRERGKKEGVKRLVGSS